MKSQSDYILGAHLCLGLATPLHTHDCGKLCIAFGAVLCTHDCDAVKQLCSVMCTVSMQAEGRAVSSHGEGGGMYLGIWSASADFTRPVFLNNTARSSGGGLHALAVLSDVSMMNTTATTNEAMPTAFGGVIRNTQLDARAAGGAVYVQGSQSKLILTGGAFSDNKASQGGAVAQLADSNSSLIVTGPISFSGNRAKNMGGAVSSGEGVNVKIERATFLNNHAIAGNAAGGGLYCQRCGQVTLIGSNFSHNSAPFGGGAALLQTQTPSYVANTTFFSNVALPPGMNTTTIKHLHQEVSLEAQDARGKNAALFEGLQGVDNTTSDSGAYAGGGGLYISVLDRFDIIGDTAFHDNTGQSGGEWRAACFEQNQLLPLRLVFQLFICV